MSENVATVLVLLVCLGLLIVFAYMAYRRFFKTSDTSDETIVTIYPFQLVELGYKGPIVTSRCRAQYTEYFPTASSPDFGPVFGLYELDEDAV